MANILIDVEREKYPHSGLGFFARCLRMGLRELAPEHLPQFAKIAFYGVDQELEYRHHAWHRLLNPSVWGQDVIHVTHQLQSYFPYIPKGCRYILTLHDLNFLYEELSPRQRARRLSLVREHLKRADIIVCISHFVAEALRQHLELFSLKNSARIEVIHNGLKLGAEVATTAPRGLVRDKPYLLNIGVLHEKKQQHLLIEMLPHLPESYHLVLVYSHAHESYMGRLLERVDTLGLYERVHLMPSVSEGDKQYLLQHATAYLHPSLAEGFGIPPIEAMYQACPVFLSRLTSLPEVGGSEVYYFDELSPQAMARCLTEGLQDFALQADKGSRLRAWASHYDYRRMAREYLALYQQLIEP